MSDVLTIPNADLEVIGNNKSRWSHADHRRHGWHNLYRIARYSVSFRAARVMTLEKCMDLRIAQSESVRWATSLPWFSAMVVVRDQHILFERYASDFSPHQPHSIQSITKSFMNLIVGKLVGEDVLDLDKTVAHYLPEIGSGYAPASLQQVLNMDVVNNYSQDFSDPNAPYYDHEEAMGWRLPRDPAREDDEHSFVKRITSADTVNRSGCAQYKDANTAVLGWVVEHASGRPLRLFLADIADAAGLEGALHITTDRKGVPTIEGGACLTARDLARYFSIYTRRGRGIDGAMVGSAQFITDALSAGVPMSAAFAGKRYSNCLMVSGRSLGHAGWGGQYAMANMDTGTIGVFFSVLENEHAINEVGYMDSIICMLEEVTSRD